ncbi:MAG: DNA polymerase III subunit delta [Defluviitaleaceae bacterium]|nr:DNA polymerase III subunit delta [Defluviitaleaceae bacterium]
MSTKELNQHVKIGEFVPVYLFYGTESFLIGHWQKRLLEALMPNADFSGGSLNFETMDGKTPAPIIINSAETLPFMSERRVILLRDTGLFESGRKDDSEAIAEYIKDIPETTVIIFVESKVDKRGKLFKRVKDAGFVLEAATPQESELAEWATKLCAARGKNLARGAAFHLIRSTKADMQHLYNELEKLVSYVGDTTEITVDDVDTLCAKSLDVVIFDLTKALAVGDARTATGIYHGLIAMKESPLMVLSMIARQFRFYLQCGELAAAGMPQKDIAAKLGQHPFAVKEFVAGSRKFTKDQMLSAFENCLETDFAIKSGEIPDVLAVETLIVKLCALQKR